MALSAFLEALTAFAVDDLNAAPPISAAMQPQRQNMAEVMS